MKVATRYVPRMHLESEATHEWQTSLRGRAANTFMGLFMPWNCGVQPTGTKVDDTTTTTNITTYNKNNNNDNNNINYNNKTLIA